MRNTCQATRRTVLSFQPARQRPASGAVSALGLRAGSLPGGLAGPNAKWPSQSSRSAAGAARARRAPRLRRASGARPPPACPARGTPRAPPAPTSSPATARSHGTPDGSASGAPCSAAPPSSDLRRSCTPAQAQPDITSAPSQALAVCLVRVSYAAVQKWPDVISQ